MPSDHDEEGPPDLVIESSEPRNTVVREFKTRIEFILQLRISSTAYVPLELKCLELLGPWSGEIVWLRKPQICNQHTKMYRLESGRQFEFAKVLNHRLFGGDTLEAGRSWEGIVLGIAFGGQISRNFIHDDPAHADLVLTDQYGREHATELEVLIDRSATIRSRVSSASYSGLYGGHDHSGVLRPHSRNDSFPSQSWRSTFDDDRAITPVGLFDNVKSKFSESKPQ